MPRHRELLAFHFDHPESRFEGHILGALERAESGGAIRVLEVLFVIRDPDSGDVAAMRRSGGAAGLIDAAVQFRLDAQRRRELTRRALAASDGGDLEKLGDALAPGSAAMAILVEHVWAAALDEAVTRSGGRRQVDEMVAAEGPEPDLVESALAAVGAASV